MTTTTIDKEKIQELMKKYQEHLQVLEESTNWETRPKSKHVHPLELSLKGGATSLKLVIKDLEELLK